MAAVEALLARQPPIPAPTISLHGASDGVVGHRDATGDPRFTGGLVARVLPGVGHNIPREAPEAFAAAIRELAPAG